MRSKPAWRLQHPVSRPYAPGWWRRAGGRSETRYWHNSSSGGRSRATGPQRRLGPTVRIVGLLRAGLEDAVRRGELGAGAASDEGMALLSTMHFGVLSQHLANDPDGNWEHGVFTRLHPSILEMFVAAYPPEASRRRTAR